MTTEMQQLVAARSRLGTAAAAACFVTLEALVVLQVALAQRDGLLTHDQMVRRGFEHGLPLIWHFGVWSDAVMLSGLIAWIVYASIHRWKPLAIVIVSTGALAVTIAMTWSYTKSSLPEAHVVDQSATPAGWAHAAYMWIALTVVALFFTQQPAASLRLRLVVSWLILAHVFIGTHMLLGLLAMNGALPWYQEKPLQSLAGWAVLAATAAALLIANVGLSPTYGAASRIVRATVRAYLWLTDQQPEKAKGYLKLLDHLVETALASTAFFLIAYINWKAGVGVLPVLLVLVIAATWHLSRLSVKQELRIVDTLFPADRFPDDLSPKSRASITVRVAVFTLSYLLLAWFSGQVLLISLCLLIIGLVDYFTRWQINKRFAGYLSDPSFAPDVGERGGEIIEKRRQVVRHYLFVRPHLAKEFLRILGFAIAFSLAALAWLTKSTAASNGAYLLLIVVSISNEVVTVRWRLKRDRDLVKVDTPAPPESPPEDLTPSRPKGLTE